MVKTFIDVTQLVHLQGKVTGIPRVMDELARRFLAEGDSNTVFVSWVKEVGDFCEIDFAATRATHHLTYLKPGASSAPTATAGNYRPSLQIQLQHKATALAKKGFKVAAKVSPELSEKLKHRVQTHQPQNYKPADFGKGDIIFIPWGEWWDPQFTDRLVDAQQRGAKLVQIIHDVATMVWPQFFEQVKVNPATYNSRIVPIADLVLTVSENTKRELVGWLKQHKLHVPRVQPFRLGDDIQVGQATKPHEEAFTQAKLRGNDYLMCVGTIEAKKNHLLFYYVYKLAKARGIDLPKLVIVGRRGWGTNDAYALMTLDPEVKDKFVFLHDCSDEELSWLFDHCLFTVQPSFHEGWGIPIAESLGRGVPCISGNTSSMVEIAEGIVEHFSPASSDECLAAIQLWLDPAKLQAARTKVKKYKPWTWDKSFQQVQSYLKEI